MIQNLDEFRLHRSKEQPCPRATSIAVLLRAPYAQSFYVKNSRSTIRCFPGSWIWPFAGPNLHETRHYYFAVSTPSNFVIASARWDLVHTYSFVRAASLCSGESLHRSALAVLRMSVAQGYACISKMHLVAVDATDAIRCVTPSYVWSWASIQQL